MISLSGTTVLVTGATGSFGTEFIRTVLERHDVKAIRAFSRDELKQGELRQKVDDSRLRLLLGDVRDLERLRLATRGVDVIIHAAALKQVPALEYNPFEAIRTNVLGTQNVITAAIENRVREVMGLSTDKAVAPTNLYGASKLCSERLLAQAGAYSDDTFFAAVRYGNVVGSRGSVVPIFREQALTGVVTITDERMTRYWITLAEAVDFVLSSLARLEYGGEVFVPKIPSARVVDIAEALAPGSERMVTGIRPGEKLHETLLTEDESRHAYDAGDRYIIERFGEPQPPRGERLPDGFTYSSDTNEHWLSVADLRALTSAKERAVS